MKYPSTRTGNRILATTPLLIAAAFTAGLSAQALAADDTAEDASLGPIVVTATRTPVAEKNIASAVTIIEREEIENSGKARVVELLRNVPGLTVIQSGGPGQVSSIFMRGTESNHVLVLIDGVEISDPSNPTGQVDFSNLLVEDIERIEIVRGPQSTLYGSDAIGGVIQIIPRRDDSSSYRLEVGDFGTVNTGAGLRKSFGRHRLGLSAGVLDTAGTSAANPDRGNHDEKDAYRNATAALHWASRVTDSLEISFDTRLQSAEAEIDEFYDIFPAPSEFVAHDPDSTGETDQSFSRLQANWISPDGSWAQQVSYSRSTHERRNENGPAGARSTPSESEFNGNKSKLDWQQTLNWRNNSLIMGAEVEDDRARGSNFAESIRNSGFYLQDQAQFTDAFSTAIGVRHDKHDLFGGETTWRIAPLLHIGNSGTRLKASYGTGFKAPSLSELFESSSFVLANPDLQPEKSKGWDIGFEQAFGMASLEVIYFKNDIEDLITFVFDPNTFLSSPQNVQQAETEGYEAVLGFSPLATLDVQLAYTRTETENLDTGEKLLRRPENEVALNVNWRALSKLRLGLNARQVGKRDDFIGFTRGTLDSYKVVDLNADYSLTPSWTLTLRVDNVNDEEYEETAGYAAPGRAGYVGVRWLSR